MKVWNYVVIFTGLSLLLELGGISSSGFTSLFNLIGVTLNATGISHFNVASNFQSAVFGAAGILIAVVSGVVIGAFTRSSPENYIILPFITGTLYFYISIIVGIVNYGIQYSTWVAAIGALILIPLTVGFITALVEFFRGTD